MTKRTTDGGSGLLCAVAIVLAAMMVLATSVRVARAGETPVYGPDGKYQGSAFDYGRTQTYTDRSGHFTGSAGSSIDRALNFGRGR